VTDDGLGGSDALTTAKVLAAAIGREPFDVVITATESTDGYTGIVPRRSPSCSGSPLSPLPAASSRTGRH